MMKKRGRQIIEVSVFVSLAVIIGMVVLGGVLALDVEQTVRVNVLAGEIDVISPASGIVYDSRMVPINLSMNSEVDYFRYVDNGGRMRTLCRGCDEYGADRVRRKPFDDGAHTLDVIGVFPTGEIVKTVEFIIDSKDPKIRKTLPRRRKFSDGVFSVTFQEANPVESWLIYGNDAVGFRNVSLNLSVVDSGVEDEVVVGDCFLDRRNTECEKWVNLTDYDGSEVSYWFNLSDIAGNEIESKKVGMVEVDISAPVVSEFDYVINGRRVEFMFKVSDPNFDEINYINHNDRNPRWRRFCSRLDRDDVCEKRTSFRVGDHNLSFDVIDEVGNNLLMNDVVFSVA